jgi:hypothetical protein
LGGLDVNALRTSQPNTPSLVLPEGSLAVGRVYTFRLEVQSISTNDGSVLARSYSDMIYQTTTPPASIASTPLLITPTNGGTALRKLHIFYPSCNTACLICVNQTIKNRYIVFI